MEERGSRSPSTSIHVGDDHPATKKPSTTLLMKYVFIFMLILKIFVAIVFGIILLTAKKDDPKFHVEHVHVTTKGENHQQHEFHITLASENPNAHTTILYDGHSNASLSFKDNEIANGTFPASKQNNRGSKDVTLTLTSFSNTKLPTEIQTSMNDETNQNSQKHVEMSLEFQVPMKMKAGILKLKSKTLLMLCHFKVNNLANNSRILSQDCDYSTRV